MSDKIWQTDSYKKTVFDVMREFSETNWDQPRKMIKTPGDNSMFTLKDGAATYDVTLSNDSRYYIVGIVYKI